MSKDGYEHPTRWRRSRLPRGQAGPAGSPRPAAPVLRGTGDVIPHTRHRGPGGISPGPSSCLRRCLTALLVVVSMPGVASPASDTLPTLPDTADITASVTISAPGQREVIPAAPNPVRPGESLK